MTLLLLQIFNEMLPQWSKNHVQTGLPGYQEEDPFDAGTLVLFLKRISAEMLMKANEYLLRHKIITILRHLMVVRVRRKKIKGP